MSLGLPQFGTHRALRDQRPLRVIRAFGFAVLAFAVATAAIEGRAAFVSDRALEKSRSEVARAMGEADALARSIRKNPDALIATASVESAPERVFKDLSSVLPPGVTIVALKVDYTDEATALLDFSVVAASPQAYDLFLGNLSASPLFRGIKPGSESRPGLVRASVSAVHRPSGGVR